MMDNRGFTLLELIVVSVLIGLLLSLTAPSLSKQLSSPLKTVSRKLIFFLHNSRQTAEQEQLFCKVSFSRSKKQFHAKLIHQNEIKNEPDNPEIEFQLILPESIKIIEVEQGKNTLPVDNFTIWIGPQGYMQPLALHLANNENDYISIHFEPLLFKSNVFDNYTPLTLQ